MHVGIYVYEQAEVLDFAGPFEVFSTASRAALEEAPFVAHLIGETGNPVVARGGFRIWPAYGRGEHPSLDVLIVPGGARAAEVAEMNKPAVCEWIADVAAEAKLSASVCSGAFLLAQAGVLTDQRVTTHWADIADLRRQFPGLEVVGEVRWVDEGGVVTSGGISAGIDMSLHLVARLHGPASWPKGPRDRWNSIGRRVPKTGSGALCRRHRRNSYPGRAVGRDRCGRRRGVCLI